MKKVQFTIIYALLMLIQTFAYADYDQTHVKLSYLCDTKNDKLEMHQLYYDESMDTSDLLQKSALDNNQSIIVDSALALANVNKEYKPCTGNSCRVTKYCKLKKGTYTVFIHAVLGNMHTNESYDVVKSFYVEIFMPASKTNSYDNIVLEKYRLSNHSPTNELITKSILFESALEKLTITTVNGLSMYRPLER